MSGMLWKVSYSPDAVNIHKHNAIAAYQQALRQAHQERSSDGPCALKFSQTRSDSQLITDDSYIRSIEALTDVPCVGQQLCAYDSIRTAFIRGMAVPSCLVFGRIAVLQGACTRVHGACSFRAGRLQQHLRCQQHFHRKWLAASATPGPVDSIFNHAQALIATGVSAVGMATIADKSSK